MWRTLPFVLLISSPVYAVPVVPNFSQGSSQSRTETTTMSQRLYEQQTIILGTHIQLQDQVLSMMDRLSLLQMQLSLKL